MKPTELRTRLEEKVPPRVGKLLRAPKLPGTLLESKLVKDVTRRTTRALEVLGDVRGRAEALKSARQSLRQRATTGTLRERFDDVRRELSRVLEPKAKPKARAAAGRPPTTKRKTDKPMPEMIKATSGGKRLPAAVAKRAVKRAPSELRVKKGQK